MLLNLLAKRSVKVKRLFPASSANIELLTELRTEEARLDGFAVVHDPGSR